MGNSVLASLKIESVQDGTGAILVDFAPFLVSDVTDLAEGLKGAIDKPTRFDKERSALTSVKNFPENLEVEALLTYSPNDRTNLNLDGVPDERFIPITVHYSFSTLPAAPMTPRLADDRVGNFITVKKDFSHDDRESFWVRYVERWRLEKKDPSAAVSEPVKPIVFYLDRTIPKEYRPFVKEGVEKWQRAFEAAGFKNAIIAKEAPDDSTWDAEDVRYSTIRWITSTTPSFGAIGPSRVDPRTGEILDADILFEASFIQSFRNGYRRFAGPEALASEIMPETRMQKWPNWVPLDQRCEAQMGAADGASLMHMALLMDGALDPGSPVPMEYLRQAIVWSTMHEVGHSLGLRHNFRGSTATPRDKLNDKDWVTEHGLYTSVMEYPSPNISTDRAQQGFYYTPGAGTGDLWAIRFAYTPSGASTVEEDAAFAAKIADENLDAGHEYSTDEDTYPGTALDPRSNIWDIGDDPLAFAKQRTDYISSMWKNPEFENRILGTGTEYPVLKRAMDTLLQQYGLALSVTVRYAGGSYESRVHRGQPGFKDPFVPVTAAKQKEALDLLSQRAFAAKRVHGLADAAQPAGAGSLDALGSAEPVRARRGSARLRPVGTLARDPDRAAQRAHVAAAVGTRARVGVAQQGSAQACRLFQHADAHAVGRGRGRRGHGGRVQVARRPELAARHPARLRRPARGDGREPGAGHARGRTLAGATPAHEDRSARDQGAGGRGRDRRPDAGASHGDARASSARSRRASGRRRARAGRSGRRGDRHAVAESS